MKRFLMVVAVGIIGAALLVACGGDKKPAETGGAGGSSAAPMDSSMPMPSASAS